MAREALISGKSKTFPPNYLRSLRVSLISGNITAEFPDQSSMEKAVNFQKEERILDAPDFVDDFYLNLFDWGSRNILSIALGSIVYLWNGSDGSISELVTVGKEIRPITSVSWAPDGRHIAVGLNGIPFQSHEPGWVHCHICSKG